MDFLLVDDLIVDQFARAIIKKYMPNYQWRTYQEYEDVVSDLRKKIIQRFNGDK